jgi:tellurite resistance protein
MRWFLPIICAVLCGIIDGGHGMLIGLVTGLVIALIIGSGKRSKSVTTSIRPPPLPPQPKPGPASPAPHSATVDRLHEIMRQLDATRPSLGQSDNRAKQGAEIDVSFSYEIGQQRPSTSQRRVAKLNWYAPGQCLIHAGFVIDGGMVFASDRALAWPGEPSAIITSLPVAAVAAHPLVDFGYYPSYDRISAEQRRCYLEWLAAGRLDIDPAQRSLGYVFIFFYGLERRILLDGDRDPSLLQEIIRLLEHYGPAHKSRSLKTYFLQLLHFGGWQLGSDAYRELWSRLLAFDGDRPDEDGLRFVLANLYQRGEPLDWLVACRLAFANVGSRRSTVVARTQSKFFALFEQRFREQFPTGFNLEAAKQEALVQYRPASNALAQISYQRQRNPFELRIPNVAGLHSQFKPLPKIWNACIDDLSGYSRALRSGRTGSGAALARWQALPPELQKVEDHPLRSGLDALLAAAPKDGDYTFVPIAALASLAEIPERAKLTAAQSRQIVELVNGLGWELAPDPGITGLPLAWNQEITLFRSSSTERSTAQAAGLTRLLYLAVALAAADGAIEAEELATFYQLVSGENAKENDLSMLRATEASLRRDAHVAIRLLPQMAKLIPAESKQFVLRTMAHIAASDGEVSLDELKVLRRMARSFGLDADAAETLLREDESFCEVTIASATPSRAGGEKIPIRPSGRAAAFVLNEERIHALTQETREVISMLSVVMSDAEEVPCAPAAVARETSVTPQHEWLTGLDERYRAAVVALISRDEITPGDFDCLSADNHLMPDDLFNAVNTWSDEVLGDFLLERGENITIFRSLLPESAAVKVAA